MKNSSHDGASRPASGPRGAVIARTVLTLRNFAIFSVVHSVAFTGLMVSAFALGKPQPITFIFGFTHGVMYMLMAAMCIVAARMRIVSVTTALIVVIVGLFGPYFGAYEFIREERRRLAADSVAEAVSPN